ncbi:Ubiquitin [Oryctes borbonicus]|uniref:RanBP-type and C3HC4-type zinc finger-containing protein 1 n=1 Tax=Oryctes borbonicus TaxID=1629725 RepID=A0A0T6AYS7_9SCAR|nr:Ubiquitin [Oryctes borbonicus]
MNSNEFSTPEKQSQIVSGTDQRNSKRNSGLLSFFKWFKQPGTSSRESVDSSSTSSLTSSGSTDSVNSTNSTGTVASFSFITPDAYNKKHTTEKSIVPGPETDTYKARLKQREKFREKDKNITLRKKYNLFFHRDTLLKPNNNVVEEDNSKSLPLMTKKSPCEEPERLHRRTASESSKIRKAGAYCHVKGKRKAPQPPSKEDTFSLRRKKRAAPAPPIENQVVGETPTDCNVQLNMDNNPEEDVICNDSLKLDHGILKPAKDEPLQIDTSSPNSARSSYIEAPVSPRPWYKRHVSSTSSKKEKHDPATSERLPELQYSRNSTADLNIDDTKIEVKRKDDKRKSGISFLTNISELDREATELLKKDKESVVICEMPVFMRPKSNEHVDTDSLVSPKRKSTKDLIAKFNAITNVTKVTVNAFQRDKREYFGGKSAKVSQDTKKAPKKNQAEPLLNPLMKSESASVVKSKSEVKETPKLDRISWYCPKCHLENDYWRIICHVCSTIKPYFDDLSAPPTPKTPNNVCEEKTEPKQPVNQENKVTKLQETFMERNLERSKTQIGFSALSRYNNDLKDKKNVNKQSSSDAKNKEGSESKKQEREKLIKMLIEMKNSLPKRKVNATKDNKRTSIIEEGLEALDSENKLKEVNKMEGGEGKKLGIMSKDKIVKKDTQVNLNMNEEKVDVVAKNKFETKKTQIIKEATTKENIFVNKEVIVTKIESANTKVTKETRNNVITDKEGSPLKQLKTNFLINQKIPDAKLSNNKKEPSQQDSLNKIILKEDISNKTNPTMVKEEIRQDVAKSSSSGNQKELLLVTQKTIYENIKVQNQRPQKVSSSAQTSAIITKTPSVTGAIKKDGSFELIKPKDFADIYNEKMGKSDNEHLYANWDKPNPYSNESMSIFVNIPKRLSDLKNADFTNAQNNMDTLEINRLLRRLETAIAKGEMTDAAVFARELAQLKVNCSVIRQRENKGQEQKKGTEFTVNMFVEDRLSHRGPFTIPVTAEQTVGKLKQQVEKDFEIPTNVQRWILGKELATDDKSTLKDHHVTTNGCPVFLYLVAPNRESKLQEKPKEEPKELQQSKESESKNPQIIQESIEINIQKTELQQTKENGTGLLLAQPSTSQQESSNAPNKTVVREILSIVEKKVEPPKAAFRKSSSFDEDLGDYDCKTLRPQKLDWECKMCTLLNPSTSNVCAVCATVRQKEQTTAIKAVKRKAPQPTKKKTPEAKALHLQLLDLDNGDFVSNTEAFECMVCLMEIGTGDGVTLRECLHQFCKQCLAYTIEFTDDAEIKCPYRDDQYSCDIALQDREIKALVAPNIYEQYLARSVMQVENKIEKSFHCKTPDCKGWCIFEDNVNEFKCPVCLKLNCLTCQAIHTGMNCKQYQEKMNAESDVDENAKRTREMLEEMVNKGEALTCPVCQVILMKKWGCDWIRCSMCKTEICWVTRGPRWGPSGKGDTSGGCKCGVNGVKCHAQCNYCH